MISRSQAMSDEIDPLSQFTGRTRLFPLPNLVLFPHVLQPLHIFEPRYRQMTADALAGDRLLTIAMLKPGWDNDYDAAPAIFPIACLGKIIADQRLEDGRYNLLLRGLARVRVLREVAAPLLYRTADVELLADTAGSEVDSAALADQLSATASAWVAARGGAYAALEKILGGGLPLGILVDVLTYALPLSPEVKQELLEELSVQRRVECLLTSLGETPAAAPEQRQFPPGFSIN